MSKITKKQVLDALGEVSAPDGNMNVVAAGMISSVITKGSDIGFVIEVAGNKEGESQKIRQLCEEAVTKIPNIGKITAVLTAEISADASNDDSKIKVEAKSSPKGGVNPPTPKQLEFVKNVIAIGSGKGGVGKSTVAVNLAVSLSKSGYSVGLVDADIYGPSVARMMKLEGEPDVNNGKMVPPESYGVKCMSMGLIIKEDVPVVWRGPMVTKALQQLMLGADWGKLDYLVLDLPPGTGDIHLTLAQNFTLSGAVIVSTPQEIALMDVRKAIAMFRKVRTPILGIIENMSYFVDEDSGKKTNIFGEGGVSRLADDLNINILGQIPINPKISECSDMGKPIASCSGEVADIYNEIAGNVVKAVKS